MLREVRNVHFRPRITPFSVTTTASTATLNIGSGDFTVTRTGVAAFTLVAKDGFSRTAFVYATTGASIGAGSYVRWNGVASSKSSWDISALTASGGTTEGTVDGFIFGFDSTDLSLCKFQRVLITTVRPRVLWGKVTGSTGVLTSGSKSFKVTRTVAGTYTVLFTPGFGTTPVMMAQGISTSVVVNCNVTNKTAEGCTITTAPETGTPADADFYIMAIGQDTRSDAGKNRTPLLNNQRRPRIIAGEITNTGGAYTLTIGGATGGTDWTTLLDNGPGDVSVTIATPFSREPALFSTTSSIRVMANYSANVTRYVARNAAGAATDISGQTYIFAIGSDDITDY